MMAHKTGFTAGLAKDTTPKAPPNLCCCKKTLDFGRLTETMTFYFP